MMEQVGKERTSRAKRRRKRKEAGNRTMPTQALRRPRWRWSCKESGRGGNTVGKEEHQCSAR